MSTITRLRITWDKCETDISNDPDRAHRIIRIDGQVKAPDLCGRHDKAMSEAVNPWLGLGVPTAAPIRPARRRRRQPGSVDALSAWGSVARRPGRRWLSGAAPASSGRAT